MASNVEDGPGASPQAATGCSQAEPVVPCAFTPGHWRIDGFSLVVGPDPKDGQFRVIADCRANARANARLIAAAPELYEALANMHALAKIKYGNLDPDANVLFAQAEAVLAKALGHD